MFQINNKKLDKLIEQNTHLRVKSDKNANWTRKKIDEHSKNFNKEQENVKKKN